MTLSIIVPVYNVVSYLNRCLDSAEDAVARAKINSEMICVDDGSTDGSGEILDKYAASLRSEFLRITIVHQQNAGVSAARNAALDKATGEWVMMLDGDDRFSSDLLVRLCEIIHENPDCDAVGFGVTKIDKRGEVIGEFGCPCQSCVATGNDILLDGRGPKSHFIWASWDKIYKRSVIEKFSLRYAIGMRLGEDSLFAQMFFSRCGKVVLAPEIKGYLYLMRDGSAIHSQENCIPDQPFRSFFELYSIWKECRGSGVFRRLQLVAADFPALGKSKTYTTDVRPRAIEFLLGSKEFMRIVGFMILHGTWKSRVFALIYSISPRFIRRKILQCL